MAIRTPPGFSLEQGLGEAELAYEPLGEDDAGEELGLLGDVTLLPTPDQGPVAGHVPENTPRPQTVAVALATYGLSPLLGAALISTLGCSEEDSAEALADLPESELPKLTSDLLIGDELRPATYFEKGAVHTFFRKLRSSWAPAPLAPTAPKAPPPATPIVLHMPDTSDRLEYRDFLEQTARGTFKMLPRADIKKLHERYLKSTGAPTTGEIRPSDAQLSALSWRLRPQEDGSLKPPFVEFAVFGPHNVRSVKLRQFHAHVLTREGKWHRHLLTGPSDYFSWEASWGVFEAAMIMLDVASAGQLRLYKLGIRTLVERFPKDWGTISQLDETVRSEQWERLHQEILDGTIPTPQGFVADRPWGTVIAESRFNYLTGPLGDWWRNEEIKLERAQHGRPAGTGSVIASGVMLPSLPSHSSAPERNDTPRWGTPADQGQQLTKKQRKQLNAQQNPRPKPAPTPKPKPPQTPWLRPKKGAGKGGKAGASANGMPEGYTGCHHCGSKKHFLKDCPQWNAAGQPSIKKTK